MKHLTDFKQKITYINQSIVVICTLLDEQSGRTELLPPCRWKNRDISASAFTHLIYPE